MKGEEVENRKKSLAKSITEQRKEQKWEKE